MNIILRNARILSFQKDNEELSKWIESVDIVSFDIFDTLLVRGVLYPADLFLLMEPEIKKILGNERTLIFRKTRVRAEELAREKLIEGEEVTLEDIYQQVQYLTHISDSELNKIKELEIQWEERILYPRAWIKIIYQYCLDIGKDIIIISDMYLSSHFLKKVLVKNGYNKFKKLYVSSEYKLTKHTGNLYSYVIKDLNIKSYQLLHIGDNYNSDINKAKEKGLKTFFVPKPKENANKVHYMSQIKTPSLSDRIFHALMLNRFYDKPQDYSNKSFLEGDFYHLGYKVFAPSIIGMVIDMVNTCIANEVKDVFFLQRDGYIPRIIFDKIIDYFSDKKSDNQLNSKDIIYCRSHDLLVNRIIVNVCAVCNYSELLNRYNYKLYCKDLANTLLVNFSPHKLKAILKQYNIPDQALINSVDTNLFSRMIIENNSNLKNIEKEFINYLNNKFKECDINNTMIFDIGYNGSSDMIMSLLIPKIRKALRYNLAYIPGNTFHHNPIISYLDDRFFISHPRITAWYEIALSSTASQAEIAQKEGFNKITDLTNRDIFKKVDLDKIISLQEGIVDSFDILLNIYGKKIQQMIFSKTYLFSLLGYMNNVHSKDQMSISFPDSGIYHKVCLIEVPEPSSVIVKEIYSLEKWVNNIRSKWYIYKIERDNNIKRYRKLLLSIYYKNKIAKSLKRIFYK